MTIEQRSARRGAHGPGVGDGNNIATRSSRPRRARAQPAPRDAARLRAAGRAAAPREAEAAGAGVSVTSTHDPPGRARRARGRDDTWVSMGMEAEDARRKGLCGLPGHRGAVPPRRRARGLVFLHAFAQARGGRDEVFFSPRSLVSTRPRTASGPSWRPRSRCCWAARTSEAGAAGGERERGAGSGERGAGSGELWRRMAGTGARPRTGARLGEESGKFV